MGPPSRIMRADMDGKNRMIFYTEERKNQLRFRNLVPSELPTPSLSFIIGDETGYGHVYWLATDEGQRNISHRQVRALKFILTEIPKQETKLI